MIYALVAGLIIGAALTWFVHRDELEYLRRELAQATDRLAHARIEKGAEIAPRPVEYEPPEPLPAELQQIVNEWEDPESRAVTESKIRGWIAEGWGNEAILRQFNAHEQGTAL